MHQPYTPYYANELPERHRALVDVRCFGPNERFVFEPYTQDMFDHTQTWIDERGIFPTDQPRASAYAEAVIRLEAAEPQQIFCIADHAAMSDLRSCQR